MVFYLLYSKSFINCLYYGKTRKFIDKNYTILNIENCNDNYIETKQETITFYFKIKNQLIIIYLYLK